MFAFKWLSTISLLSALLGSSYAASIPTSMGDSFNGTQRRDSTSYVQVAYFTNWGIYAPNFQPTDIDPSQLTHILYAFADVSPSTGKVFLTDTYSDQTKHYPGDSWNDKGNNLYGSLKQLYLLKLAHRNLKVLLTIGGWTYSQGGHFSFLTNSALRQNFASSVVQLVKDYGFDGIDIDFEYPANEAQGQGFLALMTSIRSAFDNLAIENGDTTPYEITAAVSAASKNNAYYPIPQLDRVLTYWNLMAYDYSGSWSTLAENQANLYGGSGTGISTDAAVTHYVSSGATPRKIVMGIPLYGRAFEKTGGIGQPYSGVGPGTLQAGIYSYKDLPLPGASVFEDLADVASYSYDSVKKELVSYDIPEVVRIKADYVKSKSLGGCMFWELSTDRKGSGSLVQTAGVTLGQLDQTPNHIHYPNSKWDNIRNNMGGGSTPPPPPPPPTRTTSTHAQAPTPTGCPPVSCMCVGVSPWKTMTAYTKGDEVVYNGHLWTAKWWTENDRPGGAAGVWEDDGACN